MGRQGAGKAGKGRGEEAAGMWQGLQRKHLPSSSARGWHPSLANPIAQAPYSPQFPCTSRLLAPSLILSWGLCCRMPAPRLCWPGWRSTACLTSADPASASTSSSAKSSWVSCGRRKQVSHCGRHGGKGAGLPLARWLLSMALGWKGTARPFLGGVTANPRQDFHKTNEVFTPQPCSCLYRLTASVGLSWNSCLAAAAGFAKAVRG